MFICLLPLLIQSKHVGLKTDYMKNKGFDDSYFKKMIIGYLIKFNKASRQEINELLMDKLPDLLKQRTEI